MEDKVPPGGVGELLFRSNADRTTIGPVIRPARGTEPGFEEAPATDQAVRPGKLGLSLAGGGFRASLFHVGVLRRLAELDVLRRVEVLSTVSGGSITGALYVLLLKKHLEESEDGVLTREQYVAMIGELEGVLVKGVQKNLRTRLLMNPLGILSVLLSGDSMGRRMGRLYERYLFADIVSGLKGVAPQPWWRPTWLWPGQIRLSDLTIRPKKGVTGGTAAYNAEQRAQGGSVLTTLALNATTLNSGGRFHFSAGELGDWYLGYVREGEAELLLARKMLLALTDKQLERIVYGEDGPPTGKFAMSSPEVGYAWQPGEASRAAALALRRRWAAREDYVPLHDVWQGLHQIRGFPGSLEAIPLGILRRAKVAAWYLRIGANRVPVISGGQEREKHLAAFWAALGEADPDLVADVRPATADPSVRDALLDYVVELYWLRSAERVSGRIREHWKGIRLGHAVAASACFPPVFPPFLFHGIYDDLHVSRLGLTDGGVYDNMGITGLLDEGCTEVIASDTGGLFDEAPASPGGRFGLAARIPNILMRALGGLQREGLRERGLVSRQLSELLPDGEGVPTAAQESAAAFLAGRQLDSFVYFHIASPAVSPDACASGAAPPIGLQPDAIDLARLRTDLDSFGDAEHQALVNRGHDLTDRHVRRYGRGLLGPAPDEAPAAPYPPDDSPVTQRILQVGASRFFRTLKLRHPACAWSWAATVTIATFLVALAWLGDLTINRILAGGAWLVRSQVELLDAVLSKVAGVDSASSSRGWLAALLALCAVVLLVSVARGPRVVPTGRMSGRRMVAWTIKWVRALRGNLLWALFGLPALVAGALAIVSGFSYVFYHRPFLAATRIRARASGGPPPEGDGIEPTTTSGEAEHSPRTRDPT